MRPVLGHLLAACVIAAGLPLIAASCNAALGIGEPADAPVELCGLVSRCYGQRDPESCSTQVYDRLNPLGADQQTKWLENFEALRCLSDCDSALRCVNDKPLCDDFGSPCALQEHCCGYSAGTHACRADSGTCCKRRGSECVSDDQCCPGEGLCEQTQGSGKRCGGITCAEAGARCVNDFDCCTDRCGADQRCEAVRCREDGVLCDLDQDCCNGFCAPSPTGKRCGSTTCGAPGADCEGAEQCCEGLRCIDEICARNDCYPDNGDCSSDGQCCSHYCDLKRKRCGVRTCQLEGTSCATDLDCCKGGCVPGTDGAGTCRGDCQAGGQCPNAPSGEGCCSGACGEDGYCVPTCKPPGCANRRLCEAPPSKPGSEEPPTLDEPLAPECFDANSKEAACMIRLCADDPFCCCVGWDVFCVARAAMLAGSEPGCENFACATTGP